MVPTTVADAASTTENQPVSIAVLANDTDAGGAINPSSVAVTTAPAHGSTAVNASTGAITYTPTTGFIGTDTFKYDVAGTNGAVGTPATVTVTVAAPGGNSAAGGTPQLPSLLSGYAARPGWQVAGVDYAVGVPSGAALLDPTVAANLPAGASIDAVNHMIDVHGNNVTLSGYDFSLHGGWGVTIEAGTTGTTTISNSNFVMGSGEPIAINAQSTNVGNLTVLNDTFNGTQQNIPSVQPPPAGSGLSGAINYNGNGTFVAEYNDIFNMPGDGIDFSSGTVTPTIEYNLFAGLGYTPGAHADPVQFYGDTVNNAVIDFNTIYSPQGSNKSANEGLQIEAQGGSTITNTQIENNVIIATGPTMTQSLSIATWQDSGNTLSGVTVTNNYVDPTASYGALGTGSNAPQGSGLVFNNNINMLTGAAIANPAGSSTGTSPTPTVPTAVADSASTAAGHAVSIAVLANDTDAGGTINLGSVAVTTAPAHGSTAVNASTGAITYTPAAGFSGTDTFKYDVADTDGSVSTPATVTVTVAAPTVPTAVADSASTAENQAVAIAVLANDTDAGGTINPSSVAVTTAPAHGSTAVNASTGAITYTPTTGFIGTDTFKYDVADTDGTVSTPAIVTVTVVAPVVPTTVADAASTTENQPVSIAVLANDTDAGGAINPARSPSPPRLPTAAPRSMPPPAPSPILPPPASSAPTRSNTTSPAPTARSAPRPPSPSPWRHRAATVPLAARPNCPRCSAATPPGPDGRSPASITPSASPAAPRCSTRRWRQTCRPAPRSTPSIT